MDPLPEPQEGDDGETPPLESHSKEVVAQPPPGRLEQSLRKPGSLGPLKGRSQALGLPRPVLSATLNSVLSWSHAGCLHQNSAGFHLEPSVLDMFMSW